MISTNNRRKSYANYIHSIAAAFAAAAIVILGITASHAEPNNTIGLGTVPVGDHVTLSVGGEPTEFIVVHQGKPSDKYDDSCNGTWLLMKDLLVASEWNTSVKNDYANSDINDYLNNDILNLFDADIARNANTVLLPYRKGNGTSDIVQDGSQGLKSKVFLLSAEEVGVAAGTAIYPYISPDGSCLDYFRYTVAVDSKRTAFYNDEAQIWWLRSPSITTATSAGVIRTSGAAGISNVCDVNYIRPAIVLPQSYEVDADSGVILTDGVCPSISITRSSDVISNDPVTMSIIVRDDGGSGIANISFRHSTSKDYTTLWDGQNAYDANWIFSIGDVNRDGQIDDADATLVANYIAGQTTFDEKKASMADVDGDGQITENDLSAINAHIAGTTSLPTTYIVFTELTVASRGGIYFIMATDTVGNSTVTEARALINTETVALSSAEVGEIVTLNFNGEPRDFIIVQQGKPSSKYDASCNGTWLLMKDCYAEHGWHTIKNLNDYANSTIHEQLNSVFLSYFDTEIQRVIKQVKVPYRAGSGTSRTVSTGSSGLSTKVFLLSMAEVGWNYTQGKAMDTWAPEDGTRLSYFGDIADSETDATRQSLLRYGSEPVVYCDWWTRSPNTDSDRTGTDRTTYSLAVSVDGSVGSSWSTASVNGIRPAIILNPTGLYLRSDGSIIGDVHAPVITCSKSKTSDTSETFFASITDNGGSGITSVSYKLTSASSYTTIWSGSATNEVTVNQSVSTNGVYIIRAVDGAGNERTETVRVDDLSGGMQVGNLMVGDTVTLPYNGEPYEFIVVNQGRPSSLYDTSCDGTWLLMKRTLSDPAAWATSGTTNYRNSSIHTYLNNAFLNGFDDTVKSSIKSVRIPYRNATGASSTVSSGSNGLSTKAFLLSGYEIGWTNKNYLVPVDGACLEYFRNTDSYDEKRITYPYEFQSGDITMDGVIDDNDSELLSNYMVGNVQLSVKQSTLADVNGDGNVDTTDMAVLQRHIDGSHPLALDPIESVPWLLRSPTTSSSSEPVAPSDSVTWPTVIYQAHKELPYRSGGEFSFTRYSAVSVSAPTAASYIRPALILPKTFDISAYSTVASETTGPILYAEKSPSTSTSGRVRISVFAKDNGGSGIVSIYRKAEDASAYTSVWKYTEDNGGAPAESVDASFSVRYNGVYQIKAVDAAGNETTISVSVDNIGATAGELGDIPVGNTVRLNVDGNLTDFIVVHQGAPETFYSASCNGTWLLMKDVWKTAAWNTAGANNNYAGSSIHGTELNATFLPLLDEFVQIRAKTVKLPYATVSGHYSVVSSGEDGVSTKVFLLSASEVGFGESAAVPEDGSVLDYFATGTGADFRRTASLNGAYVNWWLRSPDMAYDSNSYANAVSADGSRISVQCASPIGVRPALIMPKDMRVDENGTIYLDTDAPTMVSQSIEPNTWTKNSVAVGVNATDGIGYGVAEIAYKAETADEYTVIWSGAEAEAHASFEAAYNGSYNVRLTDALGNSRVCEITVGNIDKTAPQVGSIDAPERVWNNGSYAVRILAIADSIAPVDSIAPDRIQVGDVNMDGVIDENDVQLLAAFLADTSSPESEAQRLAADVNGDGKLTIGDVQRLLRHVTGRELINPASGIAYVGYKETSGSAYTTLFAGGATSIPELEVQITANGTYQLLVVDEVGNGRVVPIGTFSKIDKRSPSVTISVNDTEPIHDEATVTIAATDSGNADVDRSGIYRIWYRTPDSSEYTLLWEADSVDNAPASKTVSFNTTMNGGHRVRVEDAAGNVTETARFVSAVDETPPTFELLSSAEVWSAVSEIISIRAQDDGSGVAEVAYRSADDTDYIVLWSGNAESTEVELHATKNGNYSVRITDEAGNSTTETVLISHIDREGPSFKYAVSPSNYAAETVSVALSVTDGSGSGVTSVWLKRPGDSDYAAAWECEESAVDPNPNASSDIELSFAAEQNGDFSIKMRDAVGNESQGTISVSNVGVPADGPRSGLIDPEYSLDNGETWQSTDAGGADVGVTDGDEYSVRGRNVSGVGTRSAASEPIAVSVDMQLPTVSVTFDDAPGKSCIITVSASDLESGIHEVLVSKNGGDFASVFTADTGVDVGAIHAKAIAYHASENATYTFKVIDVAGNESLGADAVVTGIDNEPPVIEDGIPQLVELSGNKSFATIHLVGRDVGSSGFSHFVLPDGTQTTNTTVSYRVAESGTYTFQAFDNAGNSTSRSVSVSGVSPSSDTSISVTMRTAENYAWDKYTVVGQVADNAIRIPYKESGAVGDTSGTYCRAYNSDPYANQDVGSDPIAWEDETYPHNYTEELESYRGKWVEINGLTYYIEPDAALGDDGDWWYIYGKLVTPKRGTFVGRASSDTEDRYPVNGYADGYWYMSVPDASTVILTHGSDYDYYLSISGCDNVNMIFDCVSDDALITSFNGEHVGKNSHELTFSIGANETISYTLSVVAPDGTEDAYTVRVHTRNMVPTLRVINEHKINRSVYSESGFTYQSNFVPYAESDYGINGVVIEVEARDKNVGQFVSGYVTFHGLNYAIQWGTAPNSGVTSFASRGVEQKGFAVIPVSAFADASIGDLKEIVDVVVFDSIADGGEAISRSSALSSNVRIHTDVSAPQITCDMRSLQYALKIDVRDISPVPSIVVTLIPKSGGDPEIHYLAQGDLTGLLYLTPGVDYDITIEATDIFGHVATLNGISKYSPVKFIIDGADDPGVPGGGEGEGPQNPPEASKVSPEFWGSALSGKGMSSFQTRNATFIIINPANKKNIKDVQRATEHERNFGAYIGDND